MNEDIDWKQELLESGRFNKFQEKLDQVVGSLIEETQKQEEEK